MKLLLIKLKERELVMKKSIFSLGLFISIPGYIFPMADTSWKTEIEEVNAAPQNTQTYSPSTEPALDQRHPIDPDAESDDDLLNIASKH
jgi:hypothetical protein